MEIFEKTHLGIPLSAGSLAPRAGSKGPGFLFISRSLRNFGPFPSLGTCKCCGFFFSNSPCRRARWVFWGLSWREIKEEPHKKASDWELRMDDSWNWTHCKPPHQISLRPKDFQRNGWSYGMNGHSSIPMFTSCIVCFRPTWFASGCHFSYLKQIVETHTFATSFLAERIRWRLTPYEICMFTG